MGPAMPQTPPVGDADPRVSRYQVNAYQVSQGARYFSWYGCVGCHSAKAQGVLDLADRRSRSGGGFAHVFAAIADRHGRLHYRANIPTEQLWQLTAYVRDLPEHTPEKRRRTAIDQKAEARGAQWSGPQ